MPQIVLLRRASEAREIVQAASIDSGRYFISMDATDRVLKCVRASQACSRAKSRSRVLGSIAVATTLTMAQPKM